LTEGATYKWTYLLTYRYNNSYKNAQAKDKQVYSASYKTTQNIIIV